MRPVRPADAHGVYALQTELASPWPDLLDAAIDAPVAAGGTVGPVCLVAEPRRPPTPHGATDPGRGGQRRPVIGYALAVDGPERLLVELAVAPGYRRRGHGRALVGALADRPVRVTVRADDDGALAFYAALGFERVERLPGFYDLPEGVVDGVALRLGPE